MIDVPHQSPRDFRPWELLVPFYKPVQGVFMYQQAAREIADAEGWDDSALEKLEAEMSWAISKGSLPKRSRETGKVIAPDVWEALTLVTVDDVNEWLTCTGRLYRWKLQSIATQPQPKQESSNEASALPTSNLKPWLEIDPRDPEPKQPWFTPARYFARQLAIENATLLANRTLLADKVSAALFNAGYKKRGGKKKFNSGTVLKAFANVTLG
jgi:hypothetical protein